MEANASEANALAAARRLLDEVTRERIGRDETRAASGLPNVAYTSEEFLELETKLLFARSWMCASFGHDIPDPGDAIPVTAAGVPVILMRGGDGRVRAFHNVCPHRGTQLLAEPCRGAAALTCPAHGWSYDLSGQVVGKPNFEGPHQHSSERDVCLFPVRSAQWFDVIFVNIDGRAPELADYMAPFTARLEGYDFSTLRYGGTVTYDLASNWKLVHENFIEPYHAVQVHPRLEAWTPATAHRFSHDGVCFINGVSFDAGEEGRGSGTLPMMPNLSDELCHRGTYLHLFPSINLNVWPDHVAVFQLTPLAPDQTVERIEIYFVGDAADAPDYADAREDTFAMWRELNDEDVDIVERQQKGRDAPAYDGGRLSPYWDTVTHHFARLVVAGMT